MKNTFKEYYRYSHEDLNKMRENALFVIATYQKSYDQISKTISEYFDKLKSDLNKYTDKPPSIDLELLLKPLDEQINNIKEEIERRKGNHPNLMQEDNILTEITNLFDGIV